MDYLSVVFFFFFDLSDVKMITFYIYEIEQRTLLKSVASICFLPF